MSKRQNTRYPHAFSKGRPVPFVSEGSWRGGVGPRQPCLIQTQTLGAPAVGTAAGAGAEIPAFRQRSGNPAKAKLGQGSERAETNALEQRSGSADQDALDQRSGGAQNMTLYPIALDPRRWKALRVSPTIANLHKGHAGVAVICADCLHGVGHRNPGLPDRFKRQWHLTLLELEKKCRCEMCGSRNARVYPWWGNDGGELGLEGPPEARR